MLSPGQVFYRIFAKDINDLYFMHAIRNLALSMVAIFIPYYLLQLGFSWIHVGFYILLHYVFAPVFSFLAFKLTAKVGVKKSLLISIPLKILFLVALEFAGQLRSSLGDHLAIVALSISIALANSIYWMAYHVEFVRFSNKDKSAAQLGFGQIISAAAHMAAPLIGALVIVNASFTASFIIIGLLLLIGMTPILFTKDEHEPFHFSVKNLRHANAKAYMFEGAYTPATISLWPLLVIVLFGSVTTAGFLYTISNTLYIIVTYIVSHSLTIANQVRMLWTGTLAHGASLILRVFMVAPVGAALAQAYGGSTGPIYNITFHNMFYRQAKEGNKVEHIYLREFYLNVGRCITCALFIILLLFLEPIVALQATIIFAALMLQGVNLVKKK